MRMPSFSREMALIGGIITAYRVATSHPKYGALSLVAPLKRIQREIAVLVDIGVGEMMIDAGRTTLDLIREIVEARLGSNHCPVLGRRYRRETVVEVILALIGDRTRRCAHVQHPGRDAG